MAVFIGFIIGYIISPRFCTHCARCTWFRGSPASAACSTESVRWHIRRRDSNSLSSEWHCSSFRKSSSNTAMAETSEHYASEKNAVMTIPVF